MAKPDKWKAVSAGLGLMLAVQFWWWNKKAPGVLKLGKGGKGYG